MNTVLYQKIGMATGLLAQEFLSKDVGDRILSISEYQKNFDVSRGTVQNAINYLKQQKAVVLKSRGHLGTFIEAIDHKELQKYCIKKDLLGIMPLPYARSYEGLATALYEELKIFDFNMAYIRGAENRIKLVLSGIYGFAICSRYAAESAVGAGQPIAIVYDFGPGSYLSRHVLVLRDSNKKAIEDGMNIAYDSSSFDQKEITEFLVRDKKDIHFVEMRSHQTLAAIQAGEIDAGVWNYDEIVENQYTDLNIIFLETNSYSDKFASAVLIARQDDSALIRLLHKFIDRTRVIQIQNDVKSGKRAPNF